MIYRVAEVPDAGTKEPWVQLTCFKGADHGGEWEVKIVRLKKVEFLALADAVREGKTPYMIERKEPG